MVLGEGTEQQSRDGVSRFQGAILCWAGQCVGGDTWGRAAMVCWNNPFHLIFSNWILSHYRSGPLVCFKGVLIARDWLLERPTAPLPVGHCHNWNQCRGPELGHCCQSMLLKGFLTLEFAPFPHSPKAGSVNHQDMLHGSSFLQDIWGQVGWGTKGFFCLLGKVFMVGVYFFIWMGRVVHYLKIFH